MKYIAFLRGVNVGKKEFIKMADLKLAFENLGYKNVKTFINSGNVIFESAEDKEKLSQKLESNLNLKLVLITDKELKNIIKNAPTSWKKENLRKYIAFTRFPVTPKDVIKEIELKENIDFAEVGAGVVYMSTILEGITNSGFTKLIGKKIYKEITMRNFNTVEKISKLI